MNLKVLGVLAGGDFPKVALHNWALSADVLYAADSAADSMHDLGFNPVLVGDLDSVSSRSKDRSHRVEHDPDDSTTDCDKLLKLVSREGHQSITIAGIEGDMFDHVLSSLSSLVRCDLDVTILTRRMMGYVLKGKQHIEFSTIPGHRVSMIPTPICSGASLEGVEWEFENRTLSWHGFYSISNSSKGLVRAKIESGTALVMREFDPQAEPDWTSLKT